MLDYEKNLLRKDIADLKEHLEMERKSDFTVFLEMMECDADMAEESILRYQETGGSSENADELQRLIDMLRDLIQATRDYDDDRNALPPPPYEQAAILACIAPRALFVMTSPISPFPLVTAL